MELIPVFFEAEMPDDLIFEQGKIYVSRRYYSAIHLCVCGCGNKTVMPINHEEWSYGWDMTEVNGKLSFIPSVGNWNFPCRSHYFITENKINFI